MTEKPKRTTFRNRMEEMAASLREDIITGRRTAGDYLPSESSLAEQFQLSRNSIRKALEQLVSEGYVEKVPRKGNRIVGPDRNNVVTLRFGYYPSLVEEADILTLVDLFQKKYPHIAVDPLPMPHSHQHLTIRDFLQNDLVDVLTVNVDNFTFVFNPGEQAQMLEPLEGTYDLYPYLTKPFMHGDATYVQPLIFSPIILCYNKDHFAEKELSEPDSSWNWDDLLKATSLLADGKERFGFGFHLFSDNRWPIFLLQSGIRLERDESGKYDLANEKLLEGMRLSKKVIENEGTFPYFLCENDTEAEKFFLQRKISMVMSSYFRLNMIKNADIDFDIATLPHGEQPSTLLIIIGLAISKQSKQKLAAQTFIDFMLSYEAQLHIRLSRLSIPALKKAAEYKTSDNPPMPSRFHLYREISPTFRLHTDLNIHFTQLDRIRKELKLYWSDLSDLDTVRRKLEEEL
ncbi:extracellular solute-binding protein [Paenibacillus sp. MBLB4367]|uniref:extracellular solute-binding protein n=1 Tax=Paenibacillus sp. MBLB4367 TaxID=3384767 RepID=UPI0039080D34